ncbi:anti-sigma factor [Treponema sp.]|uniref:anti-sigma factor family protein n=1 Tax=Treponema sp. TaxID=166 RepID=UPI0025CC1847|nr:zf-HC2 domain-containing protein [Treponema sp.]MCR5217207.1 zf-HC2 domain-containing protein [Treponema sp.]
MSTCPEKDILSLYLDNELSPEYVKQVEEHLASCENCAAQLKKFKILKSAFAEDSNSISFTKSQIDDSFDRLMVKMSYKKNVLEKEESIPVKTKAFPFKYILSGAAAAAVVAVIIPVRVSKNSDPASNYKPLARTQLVPQSSSSYSNTVSMPSMTAMAPGNVPAMRSHNMQGPIMNNGPFTEVSGSTTLLNSVQEDRANLASYDVFGPRPEEMFGEQPDEKSKGFTLHFSSPIGNISLEIGN